MSIYVILEYVEEVGKNNVSWDGLKKWKKENWRE